MKLRIADNLALPLDAVTQTFALLAKRRAGKSYTARRIAEQIFKSNVQLVIVDPKGDWWGMRSSADGKAPGLPITILGGEHGDLPLEVGSGELLANLAVEQTVSMLLDLSLFSGKQLASFMAAFLDGLYRLKAQERYRTPVMLVIDEADAIAPQKPYAGEERMLGAADQIVRRGGQRGIGCLMACQRAAVLNKNVLTQTEVMVALRTISPQDTDAMEAWIEKHGTPERRKILMDSLPSLPIGDAWFWSPGWPTEQGIFERVHVLPIETFDSGATPKVGERRIMPKNLADVDLAALRARMADTIERAKQDDPKALRARIAELERELKKNGAPPAAKVDKAALDQAALAGGAQMAEQMSKKFLSIISPLRKSVVDAAAMMRRVAGQLESANVPELIEFKAMMDLPRPSPARSEATVLGPPAHVPTRANVGPPVHVPARANGTGGAAQRILDALAELEALGVARPPKIQVAFMSGYTNLSSKGFANAIGALRSAGNIEYPEPGAIMLTSEGRALAHASDAPRTSEELQDRLISMLGGANGRIVRELVKVYPEALPREELAEKAGYTNTSSKGFANAIGRLRSLGFIGYPVSGQVRAEDVLFL